MCVELPASLEIIITYDFTLSQMGAMFILNFPICSITVISRLIVCVFNAFFLMFGLNRIE